MKRLYSLIVVSIILTDAAAQTIPMTLNECMAYAVENSTRVKKQDYTNDNYRQDRNAAPDSPHDRCTDGVQNRKHHRHPNAMCTELKIEYQKTR